MLSKGSSKVGKDRHVRFGNVYSKQCQSTQETQNMSVGEEKMVKKKCELEVSEEKQNILGIQKATLMT